MAQELEKRADDRRCNAIEGRDPDEKRGKRPRE
jgi:hypothetical protein